MRVIALLHIVANDRAAMLPHPLPPKTWHGYCSPTTQIEREQNSPIELSYRTIQKQGEPK